MVWEPSLYVRLLRVLSSGERKPDAVRDNRRIGSIEIRRDPGRPQNRLLPLPWRQNGWASPRRIVSECTVICCNRPIVRQHQPPTGRLADCLDLGTSTRLLAFFQRGEAIGLYDE